MRTNARGGIPLLLLIVALLLHRGAGADTIIMADGSTLASSWVSEVGAGAVGTPAFQVFSVAESTPQPSPLEASIVREVLFHPEPAAGTPGESRVARMEMRTGEVFDGVSVERFSGGTFIVRQAGIPPGGQSFPVTLDRIARLSFGMPPAPVRSESFAALPDTGAGTAGSPGTSSPAIRTVPSRGGGAMASIGTFLFWAGFIGSIVAQLWFIALIYEKSGCLMVILAAVPYLGLIVCLYYLTRYWSETKLPFGIWLGAIFVMLFGLAGQIL